MENEMNALTRSSAMVALCVTAMAIAIAQSAHAQTATVYVDIVNGDPDPPNLGQNGWGSNAYRFLQDALDAAGALLIEDPERPVDIWVASAGGLTTRPDQRAVNDDPNAETYCPPYGDCNRSHSFELRNNVAIYGGFPHDPQNYHGTNQPATFADRDPVAYPTILSGDLDNDDEFCQRFDPSGPNYDPDCGLPGVGWVERSETHRCDSDPRRDGGFRSLRRSTHPTNRPTPRDGGAGWVHRSRGCCHWRRSAALS
jgi:hypothetical protein